MAFVMMRWFWDFEYNDNGNGVCDPAEDYTDSNGNGQWDGRRFTDTDGDGQWDDAEDYTDSNGSSGYELQKLILM